MEKYLSHDELVKSLSKEELDLWVRQGTSVRPNDVLQKVVTRLEKPPVKKIVEIGTWRGVSSLVMASCENVEHVWTFDINPAYEPPKLYKKFGLENKITNICLGSSQEIYKYIREEIPQCDFAYIDGGHTTEVETRDWDFMRTYCSRILVDDTDDNRVFGIFEPYGAKRISFRFAYWHRDDNYDIVEKIKEDLIWDEPHGKRDFRHIKEVNNVY